MAVARGGKSDESSVPDTHHAPTQPPCPALFTELSTAVTAEAAPDLTFGPSLSLRAKIAQEARLANNGAMT